MKRLVLLGGALCVLVLLGVIAACGSDSSARYEGGGAVAPDLGQSLRQCFGANDCLPGQYCNPFGRCVDQSFGVDLGSNAAPPDFGLPPEVENKVEPPASGKRFVYVAVPAQGTVVKIDSQTLKVSTVPIGKRPASLRTVPGQDVAVVLDRGSDTVTMLVNQPDDSDRVLRFPTAPGVNALAMSPDGKYGVAWFDLVASGGLLSDKQTFQEVTVVHLEPGQESAVNLSVGFRPSEVRFPPDGKVAWVVTDQGVSTISLATPPKPAIVPTVPLVKDPVMEPPPTNVRFTPDGKYALCRVAGYAGFRAVALPGGAITDVPLEGEPTGLEIAPDGKQALFVLRDQKQVAFARIPEDLAGPPAIATASTEPYVAGQAVLSADSARALLFTNAVSQKVMLVADLVRHEVKALPLSKSVRLATIAPDGKTALVIHNKAPGTPQPSDPLDVYLDKLHGYSIFDVQTGFAKLQPSETDPGPVTYAADGASAYVLLAANQPLVRAVEVLDLRSFLVSRVGLGSAPVSAGGVPATKQIYVVQSHALGRITFVDAGTFKTRTLTGFALNGGIIE